MTSQDDSRRGIVLSLIGLADTEGADAEAAALLADYDGADGVVGAALKMADEFRKKNFYESARRLYEYAADKRSDSKQAIVLQRKVVTANIDLGDEDGVSAAMEALWVEFADDKQLAGQVYEVGEYYRNRKEYAHARGVYHSVIEDWPGSAKAMWSAQRCIVMDIDLTLSTEDPNHPSSEVPPEIMQAIDDLIVDFDDIPALARAVFYLGEEYYLRIRSREGAILRDTHRYDNAIRIWEIVMNEAAYEKTYTPFAYYLAAHCCEQTKQYDKAVTYYKKLTEDGYRHGRYAYRAPNRLGFIYRHRKKDYEKAEYWFVKQRRLHDDLLVASRATFALAMLYKGPLRDYARAVEVLEDYRQWYPSGEKMKFIPIQMAICYEKLGMKSQAVSELQDALQEYPDTSYVERYNEYLNRIQGGAN